MKRIVNITVTYDLDEVEKKGYKLLQKKRQKEIIAKDLLNIFGCD